MGSGSPPPGWGTPPGSGTPLASGTPPGSVPPLGWWGPPVSGSPPASGSPPGLVSPPAWGSPPVLGSLPASGSPPAWGSPLARGITAGVGVTATAGVGGHPHAHVSLVGPRSSAEELEVDGGLGDEQGAGHGADAATAGLRSHLEAQQDLPRAGAGIAVREVGDNWGQLGTTRGWLSPAPAPGGSPARRDAGRRSCVCRRRRAGRRRGDGRRRGTTSVPVGKNREPGRGERRGRWRSGRG